MKVTVTLPVAPQSSLIEPSQVFDQAIEPHSSVATAFPLLVIHAWSAAVFPLPSQSTVTFSASTSIVGAVVSLMMTFAVTFVTEDGLKVLKENLEANSPPISEAEKLKEPSASFLSSSIPLILFCRYAQHHIVKSNFTQ